MNQLADSTRIDEGNSEHGYHQLLSRGLSSLPSVFLVFKASVITCVWTHSDPNCLLLPFTVLQCDGQRIVLGLSGVVGNMCGHSSINQNSPGYTGSVKD